MSNYLKLLIQLSSGAACMLCDLQISDIVAVLKIESVNFTGFHG